MKMIKEYVNEIDEELKSAELYAQKFLEYKSEGLIEWYKDYKKMAEEELNHALTIHNIATKEIEELEKIYTPSADMVNKWQQAHIDYVERFERVKKVIAS